MAFVAHEQGVLGHSTAQVIPFHNARAGRWPSSEAGLFDISPADEQPWPIGRAIAVALLASLLLWGLFGFLVYLVA